MEIAEMVRSESPIREETAEAGWQIAEVGYGESENYCKSTACAKWKVRRRSGVKTTSF